MKNKYLKLWELERYLLGELSERRMEEITTIIEENPEVRKEIENMKKSTQDILKRYPPEAMIPQILRRYKKERPPEKIKERTGPITLKRLLYVSPALALALVLLFLVFHNNQTVYQDMRIKGTEDFDITKTQIMIFRKTAGEVEMLKNGDRARAGDLLQIAYIPAGKIYGIILSIDGKGVVTLHHPEKKNESSILKQEQKVLLGAAYELDDAPDFERFFFITAMDEINVREILEHAEIIAQSPESEKKETLDLPDSYSQFSILLKKGEE